MPSAGLRLQARGPPSLRLTTAWVRACFDTVRNPPYTEVLVGSAGGGYPVRVGMGVRAGLAAAVGEAASSGRCALIADENVDALWGREVKGLLAAEGIDVVPASFPAGEAHKTRGTWAALTDTLLGAGLGRDGCVVALGGGVVGDVAGFVAATYLRGVPWVQVPTTTLAMIDASVGGKTAVDHPAGKNLVGAFHAPSAVLADPVFLTTLDAGTLAEGFAEAVKHGVILDPAHAEWLGARAGSLLRGGADDVVRAVLRSVEMKSEVVSADEFEAGRRKILNFGHTVGHAIELHSGYALPHGRAIAAGMVAEARIGEALGMTAPGTAGEIRRLVRAFGLPDFDPGLLRPRRIAGFMTRDKKTRSGVVHIVRLEAVGRTGSGPGTTIPVPAEELVRIMEGWS